MGFCSPQLRIQQKLKNHSHPHTAQHTALRERSASPGLRAAAPRAARAALIRERCGLTPPPRVPATASGSAISRRRPQRLPQPPRASRACEPGAGGGLCASPPRLRSRREEAGRRAEAGEEAGLRRAVAGAERGKRAAGTRLARLAASAHTSAPQPRASPALGSGVCGRGPERSRRNPGQTVGWTGSATPPATFCAAEVAAGMGGVRAGVWVPQSASHRASRRHGAAPSSSPRVPAGRAVCAQRREAPGRAAPASAMAGCAASVPPGLRSGLLPEPRCGWLACWWWRLEPGVGPEPGARARSFLGTGVGPATRECAARVSVRGRAPGARAASGRADGRTDRREGLRSPPTCGAGTPRPGATLPRGRGAEVWVRKARASPAARPSPQCPGRPIEK